MEGRPGLPRCTPELYTRRQRFEILLKAVTLQDCNSSLDPVLVSFYIIQSKRGT